MAVRDFLQADICDITESSTVRFISKPLFLLCTGNSFKSAEFCLPVWSFSNSLGSAAVLRRPWIVSLSLNTITVFQLHLWAEQIACLFCFVFQAARRLRHHFCHPGVKRQWWCLGHAPENDTKDEQKQFKQTRQTESWTPVAASAEQSSKSENYNPVKWFIASSFFSCIINKLFCMFEDKRTEPKGKKRHHQVL